MNYNEIRSILIKFSQKTELFEDKNNYIFDAVRINDIRKKWSFFI